MADQAQDLRDMMKEAKQGKVQERKTRIITITSGKGGVGKTNISVNMALAYAKLGKKVIVLDADLGLANVNVAMGIIPKYNLYHLIKKQKAMEEIILDTGYGVKIVAGASGFSKIANLSEEERGALVQELSKLAWADILIIDTSAGVSNNVLSFIQAADDVIVVTTPEPTAITDAYGIIKIISTELDNEGIALKLVVNRAHSVMEGKSVGEKVTRIVGQFLNLKVDYLGFVYEDTAVSSAILKQKPFMLSDNKGKAAICIRHIVSRLEKIEFKEGKGIGNFIRKFFKM